MNKTVVSIGAMLLVVIAAWIFWPTGNERVVSSIPERSTVFAEYTIIAFGDSLTAGYGLLASEAYPAQLEARLLARGYPVRVVNAGVSGETTRGNLERANFIRAQNPDLVIIGIGGNDALRLLPLNETKNNLVETIKILQSGDRPPVIMLLKMQAPLTAGLGYKQDFDALYEEIAKEYNILLVPFLTAELFFDSANKLSDGIHYNAEGYRRAVDEYILPVVSEVLDRF